MTIFSKLLENREIMNEEKLADLLNEIYNNLKKKDENFENEYLKLRRSVLETKERNKTDRKQMAIIDPAKFADLRLKKNLQAKTNKLKRVKKSEKFTIGINAKL